MRIAFGAVVVALLSTTSASAEFRVPICEDLGALRLGALPTQIASGEGDGIMQRFFGISASELTIAQTREIKEATVRCRLPVAVTEGFLDDVWDRILIAAGSVDEQETDDESKNRDVAVLREPDRDLAMRMLILQIAIRCASLEFSFSRTDLPGFERSVDDFIEIQEIDEETMGASWDVAEARYLAMSDAIGREECLEASFPAQMLFRELPLGQRNPLLDR